MIGDILYLIFCPNVTFVSNKAKDRYIGYKVGENNYIFKYSFSGYDICEINIIRKMLSRQIRIHRGDIQVNNYEEGVYKKIEILLNRERFKTFDNSFWDNLIKNYKPYLQIVNYMKSYHELKNLVQDKFKSDYEKDPSIFQTYKDALIYNKKKSNSNNNIIEFLPSLKVLDIKEDYRYYTDEVINLIENDRKILLQLKNIYKNEIDDLLKDLSNIEPKIICEKCYEIKMYQLKLKMFHLQNNNIDLFPFESLNELNNGLFLIRAYSPNFSTISSQNHIFKTRQNEIKKMMGDLYSQNCNKMADIICCNSKYKHIIGFTKKPLNQQNNVFYYISPNSPILIVFYPTKVVMEFNKDIYTAFKHYLNYLEKGGTLTKHPKYDIGKLYNDNMDTIISEFKKRTKCILCNFKACDEIKGYVSDKRAILRELYQKLLDHLKSPEHMLNAQKLDNENLSAV